MSDNLKFIIDSYFRDIGVTKRIKPEIFWKTLKKRFGEQSVALLDCINSRSAGFRADPYPLKNVSIEFANAVASQFDRSKLQSVAQWLIQNIKGIDGCDILEIGCDNGILLCFLARSFPEANFVGIDSNEQAILLATQRAKFLNLNNVIFKKASIADRSFVDFDKKFDLVIAVALFHEIFDDGGIGSAEESVSIYRSQHSIEEEDLSLDISNFDITPLANIAKIINSEGIFISVDRWVTEKKLLKWVRLCERADLYPNLQHSSIIFYESGDKKPEQLPLTIFSKDKQTPLLPCDILSFKAYPIFKDHSSITVIKDAHIAEIIFSSLDKEEIYFEQVKYVDGSGILHMRIGVAGGLGYIYQTTTRGFRELILVPSIALHEKVEEIIDERTNRYSVAEVSYSWGKDKTLTRLGIVADLDKSIC